MSIIYFAYSSPKSSSWPVMGLTPIALERRKKLLPLRLWSSRRSTGHAGLNGFIAPTTRAADMAPSIRSAVSLIKFKKASSSRTTACLTRNFWPSAQNCIETTKEFGALEAAISRMGASKVLHHIISATMLKPGAEPRGAAVGFVTITV